VQHLQVVYAAPGEGLRLRGALGPLQTEGVDGTLSWTLKPAEGGTSVTQSYVVGGYIRSGMEQWAPRIDRVLDEQLQRLKSFVGGKSPTQSQRSGRERNHLSGPDGDEFRCEAGQEFPLRHVIIAGIRGPAAALGWERVKLAEARRCSG